MVGGERASNGINEIMGVCINTYNWKMGLGRRADRCWVARGDDARVCVCVCVCIFTKTYLHL